MENKHNTPDQESFKTSIDIYHMLKEMGYDDIFAALEDLKRYRENDDRLRVKGCEDGCGCVDCLFLGCFSGIYREVPPPKTKTITLNADRQTTEESTGCGIASLVSNMPFTINIY